MQDTIQMLTENSQKIMYYHCTTTTSLPRPSDKKKNNVWNRMTKMIFLIQKGEKYVENQNFVESTADMKKKTLMIDLERKGDIFFSLVPNEQES